MLAHNVGITNFEIQCPQDPTTLPLWPLVAWLASKRHVVMVEFFIVLEDAGGGDHTSGGSSTQVPPTA
jgi:hypothetical protein